MSRVYEPSDDLANWYRLGAIVEFDGPGGQRLRGEIIRTSANPTCFHVESYGSRYQVDLHLDNLQQIGGW